MTDNNDYDTAESRKAKADELLALIAEGEADGSPIPAAPGIPRRPTAAGKDADEPVPENGD